MNEWMFATHSEDSTSKCDDDAAPVPPAGAGAGVPLNNKGGVEVDDTAAISVSVLGHVNQL
jgi:hypothetical protein